MSVLSNQAAVLLAVSDHPQGSEEILLTLRAPHLNTHSGEVAFPGGKWEPGDPDLSATALREAHEEVGLTPECVQLLGEMRPSFTRRGTRVTPYVGKVPAEIPLVANPEELSELFWFPLQELKADRRVRTDVFTGGKGEYWAPVYEYLGYTIWGFTARVLVDFMAFFYNIKLERQHSSAPEIRFKPG